MTVLSVQLRTCPKCNSAGTIVEMGLCCKVHRWNALRDVWDIPDWRKRSTCKRPGRRWSPR